MKKKILALTMIVVIAALIFTIIVYATNSEDYIPSTSNLQETLNSIEYCKTEQAELHTLAKNARKRGFSEDSTVITEIQKEWNAWQTIINSLNEIKNEFLRLQEEERIRKEEERIENEKWAQKEAEYPTATYIWKYLKAQGYNDYVCAGILGNMMAETGGNTLNIQWNIYGGSYYGICQWSRAYSTIHGGNLQQQCEYLSQTIKKEFDTFGSNYYRGFNYNAFIGMQDSGQAAIAFAKCYERCASAYVNIRATNAYKAYNYFVN